jgi:hypothetical protein
LNRGLHERDVRAEKNIEIPAGLVKEGFIGMGRIIDREDDDPPVFACHVAGALLTPEAGSVLHK